MSFCDSKDEDLSIFLTFNIIAADFLAFTTSILISERDSCKSSIFSAAPAICRSTSPRLSLWKILKRLSRVDGRKAGQSDLAG
jgi:hypothetical protein